MRTERDGARLPARLRWALQAHRLFWPRRFWWTGACGMLLVAGGVALACHGLSACLPLLAGFWCVLTIGALASFARLAPRGVRDPQAVGALARECIRYEGKHWGEAGDSLCRAVRRLAWQLTEEAAPALAPHVADLEALHARAVAREDGRLAEAVSYAAAVARQEPLGPWHESATVQRLLQNLDDRSRARRQAAEEALVGLGPAAQEAVAAAVLEETEEHARADRYRSSLSRMAFHALFFAVILAVHLAQSIKMGILVAGAVVMVGGQFFPFRRPQVAALWRVLARGCDKRGLPHLVDATQTAERWRGTGGIREGLVRLLPSVTQAEEGLLAPAHLKRLGQLLSPQDKELALAILAAFEQVGTEEELALLAGPARPMMERGDEEIMAAATRCRDRLAARYAPWMANPLVRPAEPEGDALLRPAQGGGPQAAPLVRPAQGGEDG